MEFKLISSVGQMRDEVRLAEKKIPYGEQEARSQVQMLLFLNWFLWTCCVGRIIKDVNDSWRCPIRDLMSWSSQDLPVLI